MYHLAADALLFLHVLFVLFVVLGLVLVFIGAARGWSWVRDIRFRIAHLAAIGFVVVQSWLGERCPLTSWEMALRAGAGETVYAGSFISHWLGELLYYEAPGWVFVLVYTAFGALTVAAWFLVRPGRNGNSGR